MADEAGIHATAVALEGEAVLIRGRSGSGKSDLALRLIEAGWRLVADDRCLLKAENDRLIAAPHPALAGRLEVRGVGIVTLPHLAEAPVRLILDLVPAEAVPRLPEPESVVLEGVALPLLRLDPFQASTPAKLGLAIRFGIGE